MARLLLGLRGLLASHSAPLARPAPTIGWMSSARKVGMRVLSTTDEGSTEIVSSQAGSSAPAPGGPQLAELFLPSKAYYIARKIDFSRFYQEVYAHAGYEQWLQRDGVVIAFPPQNQTGSSEYKSSSEININPERGLPPRYQYMVVYGYGSVVFVNMEEWKQRQCLSDAKSFCTEPFEIPRAEDYGMAIRPALGKVSAVRSESVFVQRLDINNLRITTGILGQTVALDHYQKKVERMLELFKSLNEQVEDSGAFTMKKKQLFQNVATHNAILTDVINNLRILERSDTAWRNARYSEMWEQLRAEFELEERFRSLDFQLELIQHNTKFFLEMLHNQRSDLLTKIIIWLITAEIGLGMYEIFGHHLTTPPVS